MKIAVLGDTHVGMRNDSLQFHDFYRRFYLDVFFPYLVKNNIKEIIQTGDLFDRRKYLNYNSLKLAREYFFDQLIKHDLHMTTYIGNHDIYFKNTLSVNAPELLLQEYIGDGFLTVVKEPTQMFGFDVIPWICDDNEKQIKEYINKSTNKVCFGHFEISGFSMEKGSVCYEGMNREDLDKYDTVISGHFHHKSTDGHIFYVGNPGQITWNDYDDERGFHIFDTDNQRLDFVRNPYTIFKKIFYDDSSPEKADESLDINYEEYSNTYVKVVVSNKLDHFQFDNVISTLYEHHPIDVTIVEDFTEYSTLDSLMEDSVDQSDDTTTIIDRYIDNIELGLDRNKLKNKMRDLYNKAQIQEF